MIAMPAGIESWRKPVVLVNTRMASLSACAGEQYEDVTVQRNAISVTKAQTNVLRMSDPEAT
jgi:hypothetical protein